MVKYAFPAEVPSGDVRWVWLWLIGSIALVELTFKTLKLLSWIKVSGCLESLKLIPVVAFIKSLTDYLMSHTPNMSHMISVSVMRIYLGYPMVMNPLI